MCSREAIQAFWPLTVIESTVFRGFHVAELCRDFGRIAGEQPLTPQGEVTLAVLSARPVVRARRLQSIADCLKSARSLQTLVTTTI